MIFERGVALVQVLIIVACLSIISAFMVESAKSKVDTAQMAMDKAQALVNAKSMESELVFAMLTQDWNERVSLTSDSGERQELKFNSSVIRVDNTEVEIQDLSSLMNVNYLQLELFRELLSSLDITEKEANRALAGILDWTDKNSLARRPDTEGSVRNGNVLDRSDLSKAFGLDSEHYQRLSPYLSLFSVSHYNPKNSPKELLALIFGTYKANEYLKLVENGGLQYFQMGSFLETNSLDGVEYITGQIMRVRLTTRYNQAFVRRGFIIEFVPYEERSGVKPFNIYERTTGW